MEEAQKFGCALPDQLAFVKDFGEALAARRKIPGYPLNPPQS